MRLRQVDVETSSWVRECQAYVEPCEFDSDVGFYDEREDIYFGTMVHGINYPDETGRDQMEIRLWNPVMRKGIIEFIRPEECTNVRKVRDMKAKSFGESDIQSADTLLSEMERGENW